MESKEIENRKRIVAHSLENFTISASSIAKKLKLPRSTVIRVVKRYKETLTVKRTKGGGRKPGPADKKLHQKIVRSIKQNPRLTDTERAKRYGTSITTGRKTRIRAGYKSHHSKKHPNRNEKQSLVAKKRARILYDNVLTKFEQIDYIDKTINPPNCPDLRPIELYWAIIKKKMFKNGESAETVEKMRQMRFLTHSIYWCCRKMPAIIMINLETRNLVRHIHESNSGDLGQEFITLPFLCPSSSLFFVSFWSA